MRVLFAIITFLIFNNAIAQKSQDSPYYQTAKKPEKYITGKENIYNVNSLLVKKCNDFSVTGKGDNSEWDKANWNNLTKLDTGGQNYESKFKILYSSTGIYVLLNGKDGKITTKFDQDFENLYEGDVFEVFFHPNPKLPLYLEYEINQLNKELVLIIPHLKESIYGWIPWHYENERRMKKMVDITGGKMEANAIIDSWSAELFFPYKLFNPLENVPPKSGTVWNANFYRLDYDSGNMIKWSWAPVKNSFHEFEKFWPIKFE
ncbi:MAG: carbohydrate-binding family 9-like protein [Segetibacter sp.]